jgi:nitroreductase
MDIFKAIQSRRSCRKFPEKVVEFEKISLMLEAASHAPSAGNLQQWKFIVVNEKGVIQKLARHTFGQHWLDKAPVVIAVCSHCEKCAMHYGKRGSELYSIQNTAAAIENMLLIATGLGLGTCWVGAFETEKIKSVLAIPGNINIHALIAVGYPGEKPGEKKMDPMRGFVFFNSYGRRIANINSVLNDYSLEIEKAASEAKPVLDSLLEKLKKLGKKK